MDILNKIQQKLKAKKSQRNDFGKYNYRSCEDILEAVKPLLGDAILTMNDEIIVLGTPLLGMQKATMKDGAVRENEIDVGSRFYIKATATIKHGEESESATACAREPFDKKGMDEAQITCATSSYARKYALNGLFAIDDAKDSDSTNKHGKEDKNKETKKPEETNFFHLLVKRCGIEGITEKEIRSILKKVGVVNNDQLKNFTSEAAIKVIKESV